MNKDIINKSIKIKKTQIDISHFTRQITKILIATYLKNMLLNG